MLYCPASNPKLYTQAPVYRPDCIIFDLEDSVEIGEKDAARDLLVEAMASLDFGTIEIIVRINGSRTRFFEEDVKAVMKAGIERIRLPMCESSRDIHLLDQLLTQLEIDQGIEVGRTKIHIGIETPRGIIHGAEIAGASVRNEVISFGAEDYTAALGVERTKTGDELLFARSTIVNVACAYGLEATDTVWSDFKDIEGFKREVLKIKAMGFQSKSCIHPSQIEIVHKLLQPSQKEVEKAKKILDIASTFDIEGGGVIALDGSMIDKPIIKRAKRIVALNEGSRP